VKHLLMDPAFPDIVGDWAARPVDTFCAALCANDNLQDHPNDFADPLFAAMAKLEIAATRLW
jgi:hypothetical protein